MQKEREIEKTISQSGLLVRNAEKLLQLSMVICIGCFAQVNVRIHILAECITLSDKNKSNVLMLNRST